MRARRSTGAAPAGGPRSSTATRVVLADGDPVGRARVRAALEAGGVVVCAECGDVPATLSAVVRLRPDVCVVDAALPGGWIVAARAIVARSRVTRIVLLADVLRDEDMVASLEAGAVASLCKGANASHLARAVAAAAGAKPPRAALARGAERSVGLNGNGPHGP